MRELDFEMNVSRTDYECIQETGKSAAGIVSAQAAERQQSTCEGERSPDYAAELPNRAKTMDRVRKEPGLPFIMAGES
jgi:hypothetical protein